MKDFKLIAIRPLENCNPKFLKVLKENEIYKFYNDYDFILSEDGKEVINIEYIPTIPTDLFNTNHHDFHLNISAIVGMNGSGKSTLTELLFVAIYNLAVNKNILKDEDEESLVLIEDIKVQIFYSLDENIFCLKVNTSNINDGTIDFEITLNSIRIDDNQENRRFTIVQILDDYKSLFHQFFFYTIAINYSIYSLNSIYIGDWINALFHKNDGYKTPVVINPMRDEGNFDINTENDLVKQRLLSNILEPVKHDDVVLNKTLRNVAENKTITGLKLIYDADKFEEQIPKLQENKKIYSFDEDKCFTLVFQQYIKIDQFTLDSNPETELAKYYVINKVIKICERYPNYKKFINDKKEIDLEKLIPKLVLDNSHITFKLKQALNYIHYRLYIDYLNHIEKPYNVEELSKEINSLKKHYEDLGRSINIIELLPPPFFDLELIINDSLSFDDLSSGEKQKIYSTSSIVYHILNLNSVENNGDTDDISIYKYKYLNILFDEVELYFHPDLQRTFISDMIEYINKINPSHINHIRGINICLATHSPFILSDIPNQNIMRLIDGEPQEYISTDKTFGANIYDLLDNDFFMKNGFIGEFAMDKIKKILDYVSVNKYDKRNHDYFLSVVNIIGDEVIKRKLSQLLSNIYTNSLDNNQRKIELLKIQQNEIQEQLKKLEKQ